MASKVLSYVSIKIRCVFSAIDTSPDFLTPNRSHRLMIRGQLKNIEFLRVDARSRYFTLQNMPQKTSPFLQTLETDLLAKKRMLTVKRRRRKRLMVHFNNLQIFSPKLHSIRLLFPKRTNGSTGLALVGCESVPCSKD